LIAAVEERVKRACWLIADAHLYHTYFVSDGDIVIDVSLDRSKPGPNGTTLPFVCVPVLAEAIKD
jgi:hypothetical protein